MTTEDGLPRTEHVRSAINTLVKRREWLQQRIASRQTVDPGWDPDQSYDAQEIRALDLAIPCLEAEFDFVSRLQRYLRAVEGRLTGDERRGGPKYPPGSSRYEPLLPMKEV